MKDIMLFIFATVFGRTTITADVKTINPSVAHHTLQLWTHTVKSHV